MDLQAAKDLNAGMWLFAKIGVVICFGLAGLLLASSLWAPAKARAEAPGTSKVQLSFSPASPALSLTAVPPGQPLPPG